MNKAKKLLKGKGRGKERNGNVTSREFLYKEL